jgi:hypothetical protein
MRPGRKFWNATVSAVILMSMPSIGHAVSCTTQGALTPQDREALTAAAGQIATAVIQQDNTTLQASLLPAVSSEWEAIRSAAENAAPLVKGGKLQFRNLYLLDATSLSAPANAQFFCSNTSGSLTVTMNMHSLPPGRYAVILADAPGSTLNAQMNIILAWDGTSASQGWKLVGLSLRPGSLDNHDGVWYWTKARELSRDNQPWSAWFSYETARALLVPVDFISSPNLEKLNLEQSQIKDSPQDAFPYTVSNGTRTWKIDSVRLDATLLHADLGIIYESSGVTDAAAQRTEATAVMSALLKAQPGLRDSFHGLWAYAMKDGKPNPIMELPMAQIP